MTSSAPSWALGYFSGPTGAFAGLVVSDQVRDLRADAGALHDLDLTSPLATRGLLEIWATARPVLSDLAANAHGTWIALTELSVHAPIEPLQVLQAGANYRKHVIDLAVAHTEIAEGRTVEQVRDETAAMMDKRKADGATYFFIGLPTAITGPHDEVTLPSYSTKHDWELELAAVIGEPAFRVSADEALDHVAAFVMVNDLTTRDLVFRRDMPEIGTDWFRSKNAPGFLPTGPYLVPREFIGDPQQLHVQLELNGDVMQNESTSDMLFTVAELVAAASAITVLKPGDLVLTGSPAGNGQHWGRLLRDGDVMVSTITGLGEQRTRVVAEAADV